MISGHSSMKKVEVEYDNGNVVVKIDSEEKVLYEDAGLTTTKSSINTFNGFSYNSILPKIGNITTFDTTNEDFLYKGIPVAAKDKGADLKLRFFKLDILDGTGVNNIFDYRFEDNTNDIVVLTMLYIITLVVLLVLGLHLLLLLLLNCIMNLTTVLKKIVLFLKILKEVKLEVK